MRVLPSGPAAVNALFARAAPLSGLLPFELEAFAAMRAVHPLVPCGVSVMALVLPESQGEQEED